MDTAMTPLPLLDRRPASHGLGGHLLGIFTGACNDNLFKQAFIILLSVAAADAAAWKAGLATIFIVPFLLCAPLAGRLADTLPKQRLIRRVRLAEPLICLLGVTALATRDPWLMALSAAALGVQSALFSAVKWAALPELVAAERLQRANGLAVALTNAAILFGTALAFTVDARFFDRHWPGMAAWDGPWLVLAVSLLVSGVGIWGAWQLPPLRPGGDPQARARFGQQLGALGSAPGLWQTALGLAGFWGVGAICILVLPDVAIHRFGMTQAEAAFVATVPGVGSIIGALLAPRLAHRAFPGALPVIGALLTGLMVLNAGHWAAVHAAGKQGTLQAFLLDLCLAGIGIGFWTVPLNHLLQANASPHLRGRVVAGASILSILAGILGNAVYLGFAGLGPAVVLQLAGWIAIAGACCTAVAYRFHLLTWFSVGLVHLLYRVEVSGEENLPREGGCLVVCNHLSYLDGVAMVSALPRPTRFLVFKRYVDMLVVGLPLRAAGVIPVDGAGSRRALVGAIDAAVAAASAGEVVAIFPEGKITRSGQMHRFQSGMERIARRAGVPIVPAYLHGLFGSLTSRSGRHSGAWFRRPVAIRLGSPLPPETSSEEARHMVQRLGYEAAQERADRDRRTLAQAALRLAKRRGTEQVVVDAGGSLTRRELAVAALALARRLPLGADEERVGVVLPPGRAGAIVTLALAIRGRTAVHLNHTVGAEGLRQMGLIAGLRTVISSSLYHRKIGAPELPGEMVAVEDLLKALGSGAKLAAWLRLRLLPARWLAAGGPDRIAALVFSSGSTGAPKGVQLSHRQLLANIEGMWQHLNLHDGRDVLLAPLPLFHSFGLTVGTWLPLVHPITVANHPDPTDAKGIGALAEQTQASFFVSTPTFVRGWMRRISPEQFRSLRFGIVGAEKCPGELRQAFKERYDAELFEGYGCTELGPVVAVSTDATHRDGLVEEGSRPGSIGRPLPGIDLITVDPETREPLPPGSEGLLVVRSPARMAGYLGQPELTAQAFVHEGYDTGDIGHIDADGFVYITGRLARFAKVGGEMVPLDKVQEVLLQALRDRDPDAATELAVSAVPDESRGERLVVLHTGLPCPPEELLETCDLPPIFTPKPRDWHQIEALPVLGTGKLDLKGLKALAEQVA